MSEELWLRLGDGVVSRVEYDAFYKRIDDDRRRNDFDRDSFFDNLVSSGDPHRVLYELLEGT